MVGFLPLKLVMANEANVAIQNPSFSQHHLRELTGIFLEKSAQVSLAHLVLRHGFYIYVFLQLRDIWLAQSDENGGSYRTDVLSWLSKATLDIIGLAGALTTGMVFSTTVNAHDMFWVT
jgi:hypothetical protein